MNTSPSQLTRSFIRRALTNDTLDEPEMNKFNGDGELIASLYLAHQTGGVEAARDAWERIKRLRPDLVRLEPRQKLIPADELKYLQKPEYMIEGYPFYAHGFNVLVGPSGGGKSFVALDFCGRLIKQEQSVVYIAGEGLHGYASRWEVLKAHLDIPDSEYFNFYCEPVQIIDEDSRGEFFAQIDEQGARPALIVIDTLARCAIGLEENSNKEMGQFVGAIDAIRLQYDCGVLVVHHTGKDGSVRGASALIAACDSAVMLHKAEGLIRLSNKFDDGGKNKHDAESEPTFIQLVPMTVGEFSSAVVRPAEQVIRSPRESGYLTVNQRAILEALEAFDKPIPIKSVVESSKVSRATAHRVLKDLAESGYITWDKKLSTYEITDDGRSAFYEG